MAQPPHAAHLLLSWLARVYVPRTQSLDRWLDLLSTVAIVFGLLATVAVLLVAARRREGRELYWALLFFAAFFAWRGITLLLSIGTILHPDLQLDWEFAAVTAVLGLSTGAALIRVIPVLQRIPKVGQLERETAIRREAEEATRERDERLRSFIEAVQDYAIYMLDPQGNIESWNSGAERIKGYSGEEILGQHFSRFYPPREAGLPTPSESLRLAAETGKFEEEGWRLRKDGSRFWANVVIRAMRDSSGTLTGFSKVTRDLTESKEMEAKFQILMECAPDGFVIINPSGRIIYCNRKMERLFGHPKAELVGKSIDLLVPERLRADHVEHRREFFHAPKSRAMGVGQQLLGLRRDGSEFSVEISLSPLETNEGRVSLAAVRDVSERTRAEARFRSLLDSAPDAMIIVNREECIELANVQSEKLFGYTRAELMGQSMALLIPEALWREHLRPRIAVLAGLGTLETIAGLELMATRKDGTQVPVEISLSPLEGPDGVSITAAIRETTDRKAAADLLAAKVAELKQSNEALEQFAHIASHDLQEPLRMVASYTQLLAKRYKGKLDGDADEFIQYAVDGTQRMKRLIEDLLVYSRAGKGGPPIDDFSTETALGEALQNLSVSLAETGATVTHDGLPKIRGCATEMVQLFQNLVGNALKYRGDRIPAIHISAQKGESDWIFSVADNGIGIEARYFGRIFQIFQRLHSREEYEGTGIGLAICQRVLQQRGGKIWVASVVGEGSTFSFSVPVK